MCLAIPGRLVRWVNRDRLLAAGEVEFAGVVRRCHLACVPNAREGDFVVVHAGVAIAVIDPDEAARTLAELEHLASEPDWTTSELEMD